LDQVYVGYGNKTLMNVQTGERTSKYYFRGPSDLYDDSTLGALPEQSEPN
jgi:hypothetical protein